jgi:hypothetical protein
MRSHACLFFNILRVLQTRSEVSIAVLSRGSRKIGARRLSQKGYELEENAEHHQQYVFFE